MTRLGDARNATRRAQYRWWLTWIIVSALVAAGAWVAQQADAATDGGAHCRVILHRGLVDGTENQPAGINHADQWGWAEVDAGVTSDGVPVGVHDARLGRLTGGHTNAYVADTTYADLWKMPHPFGPFRKTVTLIERAAELDTPIMVTINRWATVKAQGYAAKTLDTLYAVAQAHPRPWLVYFGGYGVAEAMHERHPDAALYVRYRTATPAEIRASVAARGVDLVALAQIRWSRALVADLKAAGAKVATRQLNTATAAREAQGYGINIVQGNRPKRIATRWCK